MKIVRKLITLSPFTVMGIWGVIKNNNEDKTQITIKELLTKADTLFDQGDYRSIYDLLSDHKVLIFYKLYNISVYLFVYTILIYMLYYNLYVTIIYLSYYIGQQGH